MPGPAMMQTPYGGPRHRPDLEAARRQQIIGATRACIVAKGCEATTIRDIVAASGVSAGTINYYFPGKEALLTATLEHLAAEFEARVAEVMSDACSEPLARLIALVEAGLPEREGRSRAREDGDDAWSLWLEFWGQARRRPALGRVQVALYARWRAAIGHIIQEGVAAGRFAPVQAGDVARQLAALIDGLAVHYLMGDPEAGVEEVRRLCLSYMQVALQPR